MNCFLLLSKTYYSIRESLIIISCEIKHYFPEYIDNRNCKK